MTHKYVNFPEMSNVHKHKYMDLHAMNNVHVHQNQYMNLHEMSTGHQKNTDPTSNEQCSPKKHITFHGMSNVHQIKHGFT